MMFLLAEMLDLQKTPVSVIPSPAGSGNVGGVTDVFSFLFGVTVDTECGVIGHSHH